MQIILINFRNPPDLTRSMLMARGKLSFRIRPVSESCAASKTIRLWWASGLRGRRLVL